MMISHLTSRRKTFDEMLIRDQRVIETRDGQSLEFSTDHVPAILRTLLKQGGDPDRIESLARDIAQDRNLEEHLYHVSHADSFSRNLESLEEAILFYRKYPSWWEQNVEARLEILAEHHRSLIEDKWDLVEFDIGVGVAKGTYQFGKGIVVGVADLLRMMKALAISEQAREKAYGFLRDWTVFCFKLYFGTPEQQKEALKPAKQFAQAILNEISASLKTEWEEAVAQGKETELIARWTTLGVLEVGTAVISWVKGAKAAKPLSRSVQSLDKGATLTTTKQAARSTRAKPKSGKQLWKNMKVNRSPSTRRRAMQKWLKTYYTRGGARLKHRAIKSHLRGIDFTKPIFIKKFKKGEIIEQWVNKEAGRYFTYPDSTMEGLAILGPRTRVRFRVVKDFEGAETTVARFPEGIVDRVGGPGGEQQLIVPENWRDYIQAID